MFPTNVVGVSGLQAGIVTLGTGYRLFAALNQVRPLRGKINSIAASDAATRLLTRGGYEAVVRSRRTSRRRLV